MFKKPHAKLLQEMAQNPDQAVVLGGSFFDKSDNATIQKHGGSVVSGMISAAQKLAKTNHTQAFTTAQQAVGYTGRLNEGRTPLLNQAFETMGGIVHNYAAINPNAAKGMAAATIGMVQAHGSQYEAAVTRGIQREKAGIDASSAVQPLATAATEVGQSASLSPVDTRRTAAFSPANRDDASTPGRLSAVGQAPMAAKSGSAWGTVIGTGLVLAAAAYGTIMLGGKWVEDHQKAKQVDAMREYAMRVGANSPAQVRANPEYKYLAGATDETMQLERDMRNFAQNHPRDFAKVAQTVSKENSINSALPGIRTADSVFGDKLQRFIDAGYRGDSALGMKAATNTARRVALSIQNAQPVVKAPASAPGM